MQSLVERAGTVVLGERDGGAVRASAPEHVVENYGLKLGKAHELAKVSRAELRLGVL